MTRLRVALALVVLTAIVSRAPASIDTGLAGRVHINVVNFAGDSVPHAWVSVRPQGLFYGEHVYQRANADGAMTHMLTSGAYTVRAHKVGVGSGTIGFSVLAGQERDLNVLIGWRHFYGYYHWYRIHRVGVSHASRVAHQQHAQALASTTGGKARTHLGQKPGNEIGGGAIGTPRPAGGGGSVQPIGGVSPAHAGNGGGQTPAGAKGPTVIEPVRPPSTPGGGIIIQPHAAPRSPGQAPTGPTQ